MRLGARPPGLLRLARARSGFALVGLALFLPGATGAPSQAPGRPPRQEIDGFHLLLDRYLDGRLSGDEAAASTLRELEAAAGRFAREYGLEGPSVRVRLYRDFSDEALREDRRGKERIARANEALARADAAAAEAAAAEAAEILRRIDNPDRLAVAEDLRAKLACGRGDFPAAAAHLREAILALRRIRSRSGEALALADLGRARAYAGDAGWRSSFDEGISAARSARDPETEAEILARRGTLALAEGEKEEALRVFREALARAAEAGSPTGKARALLGVAEVHLAKHDLGFALSALAEAEISAAGDPDLAPTIAERRARAALLTEDVAGAVRFAARALELVGSDPIRRPYALVVAGMAAFRAGNPETARARFEEAVERAADRFPFVEARARHDLAFLAAEAGEPLRAAGEFDRAREAALRAGDAETLANALARQAAALLAAGERDRAIETGLRARAAFEPLLATPATDRGRDLLFEGGGARVAAEATIRGLVARGAPRDLERAFEFAEWARARSLLGDLREIGIDPASELPPDLRARREARWRRYRLLCTAVEGAADAASAERLRGEIDRVREELAEIARQAREGGSGASVVLEPASFARAAGFVRSSGAAILLYFVGEQESFLFSLGPAGLSVRRLPARGPLEARAEAFLSMAERSGLVPQARHCFPGLAKALGETLLPADARALLSGGRAVIVPDGALEEIPFDAFAPAGARTGEPSGGPILSYAPSCAVLLEMDRRARARGGLDGGAVLLASGASGAPDLAFADAEVAAVAGSFDRSQVVRLEGASCRKDSLLERIGDVRVLHLALHGQKRRQAVGLRFSAGEGEEAVLWPHEVYGLNLSPDLVVLSGCSTGRGERRRGAGVLGLAHAFVLAGASRLVVSLWPVDDEAAARTMEAFYAEMRAGRGPAEALAIARHRVAASSSHREPFDWAPFVLIGPP
jgi:tetratricopeptide (TPR) repeat protein